MKIPYFIFSVEENNLKHPWRRWHPWGSTAPAWSHKN